MSLLNQAVEFSIQHEINWSHDPSLDPTGYGVHHSDPAPWNKLKGPVHKRGAVSGVIYRGGQLLKSWGDTERADQTFSVAKSYLALLCGKAIELGLIHHLDDYVDATLKANAVSSDEGFSDAHNSLITWRHLLSQTSEWQGISFGIPDQVEHNRHVVLDPKPILGKKGEARTIHPPGTYWEYNDVRINQLSRALLHLYRKPLGEVFKELFLNPLGSSGNFAWEGYEDSWVEVVTAHHTPITTGISSQRVQKICSVPGGSHWGGGVRIGTLDQARIALMMLNRGHIHKGDTASALINASWIDEMQTPCPIAPFYGLLTWLNPGRKTFPGASEDAYFMFGAGGNYVWIDKSLDAVIVVRWIDPAHFPEFTIRVAKALST